MAMTSAERTKKWKANSEVYRENHRIAKKKRLECILALKEAPCIDCGNCFPTFVMDWDHVRGEKIVNVSHMLSNNSPNERILAEIAKCDLVCANCHRIRTHTQKDGNYAKSRARSGRKLGT